MSDSTPSYLSAFLQSPGNVTGVLAGVAASVLMSFPFGMLGAAFPLLVTLGVETVACLFVPDMPSFRRWADQQRRTLSRKEAVDRAFAEISRRCANTNQYQKYLEKFLAVDQRVRSVLDVAERKTGVLRIEDLDRISDVPAEYLGLHLSLLVMDERSKSVDMRDIERKLRQIQSQIESPDVGTDVDELQSARTEYEGLIARHQRMLSKRSSIEAALLTLPDQLAEIYQMVIGNGPQTDSGKLSDAIANLRLRQDIESELSDDFSGAITQLNQSAPAGRNANATHTLH